MAYLNFDEVKVEMAGQVPAVASGQPASQGSATQAQQLDLDPVFRFKQLIPRLKESLVVN